MVRISDASLLSMLEENARKTYVELAKSLGVSETAIRKKIKKLEKEGVIKKYTIVVDYQKIGYIHAIVGVDVLPEKYFSIINYLKELSEVKSLYSSSGDHDIMVEFVVQGTEKLMEITKKIEQIEGVKRVCPALTLEKIK